MKELILNADDFGLTRGINRGIIRAHRDGILTSTTLMANAPAFEDAVTLAKENPTLGVGCHLVLVGGPPVALPQHVRSLLDGNDRLPDSLAAFVARVSSGRARAKEIEIELGAQIERVRAAGIEPTHVDTHKHTHVHPVVMSALGRVAQALGIQRVRNPVENLHDSWAATRNGAKERVRNLAAAAAVRAVASWFHGIAGKYGLRSPSCFLGLTLTGQVSAAALHRFIDGLPDGTSEIMVHPGIADADLARTGSRLQQQRQLELDALLDASVRRATTDGGVRLISYRELN